MPKVSVLMPSFNYARYLPLAIESVLSQSYSDLELIITDDCSTDNSREVVEHWKKLDKRVVSVDHHTNRGLAGARNSGFAVSSGEFVALCDADDIWFPDKLKVQMECFNKAPIVGVVHSDSEIIDSNGNTAGKRFSALMHDAKQKTSGNVFEVLCQRNFLCVPTVILRREALEYAGGFDERLRSLEDWVCWTRVSRKYPFEYVDYPLVQYRIHGASLSHNRNGMAANRVKACQFLLDSFPDIPAPVMSRMFYSLGMSYSEMGDVQGAKKAFINSVRRHPLSARSWARLCESLFTSLPARRLREL